ncbi:MAG: Gfo/Idh/MocA family oxidoreductase, partial [Chitinophagaceae bacterium]
LGGYAKNQLAPALQQTQHVRLAGIVTGTPAKADEWMGKYNIPKANVYDYKTFDRIIDNKDIDVVYVVLPNSMHAEYVIRAAKAGKHVICEKPMAITVKDCQAMIDACKKANVKLLVGYRMHFEPKTLEIVRMRNAGEFGKIKFFQGLCGFKQGNPNQWRLDKKLAGGGSIMDIGIYAINGARYMIGEEPTWVTAQETKTDKVLFKEGVDETIQFQFGFPGGAVASCLSTYAMNNLDRFFLDGDKGFAELLPSTGYGPIMGKTNKGELTQPHKTHQAVQMDEMASIIFENKKPVIPVDGEEGLKDLKIIDAIYAAVKSGQKVKL